MKNLILSEIDEVQEFFLRSIRPLDEADSGFAPDAESYSVAAQVMHCALTTDWFLEGTFGDGFDMDFEEHDKQARACTSLAEAKEKFKASIAKFKSSIQSKTMEELMESFPEDSLMKGAKAGILFGLADHTAHHRGALTVYIRLLGKKPIMPYMDM